MQEIAGGAVDTPRDGDSIDFEGTLGSLILDSIDAGEYTTYSGSLTTPGCNEIVTWINWLTPITVREDFVSETIFFKNVFCFVNDLCIPTVRGPSRGP